ncbi:MAG: redoxin domain-containing protein [Blastocatellia bacterium]|nr:redoxin domain-containing protein [Blastocatellia bacterium]
MSKPILTFCALLICMMAAVISQASEPVRRTIIYDGIVTEVASAPTSLRASKAADLWVNLNDLKRATGFEVKPKGVCRDELCFPIPRARQRTFLDKRGSVTWFNLMEFARLVLQPVAYDMEQAVWFFGPRADEQNGYIATLEAPDFTLPDMNGKMHSLSDFRGKKVLLLTWASW